MSKNVLLIMPNPTFTVFRGTKRVCVLELLPLEGELDDSNTLCSVKTVITVPGKSKELQEFCYLYCVTPSFHGRTMPPNFELKEDGWGFVNFNYIEYMFKNFPKPWRIKIQNKPKAANLPELPEGAIP